LSKKLSSSKGDSHPAGAQQWLIHYAQGSISVENYNNNVVFGTYCTKMACFEPLFGAYCATYSPFVAPNRTSTGACCTIPSDPRYSHVLLGQTEPIDLSQESGVAVLTRSSGYPTKVGIVSVGVQQHSMAAVQASLLGE
jgi:hypothetical protein